MTTFYPGIPPDAIDPGRASPLGTYFENTKVENVLTEFSNLPNHPEYLAIRFDRDQFPNHRYTSKMSSGNKLKNHVQGIQRLRDGIHFILSAGDSTEEFAQLMLFKIESTGFSKGPKGSNIIFNQTPPSTDKLIEIFHLNLGRSKYWHAGGISLLGDILAVPLENDTDIESEIIFYNLIDPYHPLKYPFSISRDEIKAGAVGMSRLPNQYFICAVWTDSEVDEPLFHFYISNSTNFDEGFREDPICKLKYSEIENTQQNNGAFQSIQFLIQENGDMYILCLENMSVAAPTFNADNYAELMRVQTTIPLHNQVLSSDQLIRMIANASRRFPSGNPFYNYDAGVGTYIDEKGQLAIYSAYHWRSGRHFRLAEFYRNFDPVRSKIENIGDAWIELYSNPQFQGNVLKIYGNGNAHIGDYKAIKIQNSSFGNRVSSVRFQLPVGQQYVLYEHPHFNQGQLGAQEFILVGTGLTERIADLTQRHFDNKTCSSSYR